MNHHIKQQHSVNRTHLFNSKDGGILTALRSDCHGYVEYTTDFYDASLDQREICNDVLVDTESESDSTDTEQRVTQNVKSNNYSAFTNLCYGRNHVITYPLVQTNWH